jgi:hypothetical protein
MYDCTYNRTYACAELDIADFIFFASNELFVVKKLKITFYMFWILFLSYLCPEFERFDFNQIFHDLKTDLGRQIECEPLRKNE